MLLFLPILTIIYLGLSEELIWISDLHLDLIYDPSRSQHDFCRTNEDRYLPIDALEAFLDDSETLEIIDRLLVDYKTSRGLVLSGNNNQKRIPMRDEPHMSGWESSLFGFDDSTAPLLEAYHGRYGCDAPLTLILSILKAASEKTPDAGAMIVTGDLSAHYWLPEEQHLKFLAITIASSLIKRSLYSDFLIQLRMLDSWTAHDLPEFLTKLAALPQLSNSDQPKIPLIMCIGNNDLPRDYLVEEGSVWNSDLYELWKGWAVPEQEKSHFIRGLYYRKDMTGNFPADFLVINSVMYHRLALNEKGQRIADLAHIIPDPMGQLEWLENELELSQVRNRQVIIVGHVPPAKSLFRNTELGFTVDSEWSEVWTTKYEKILDNYRDIVQGQYFGHIHTDEFRIELANASEVWDNNATIAKGLILMAPSISPIHGNNPSWRKMIVDSAENGLYRVRSYLQSYAPLYGYLSESGEQYYGTFDNREPLRVDLVHDTREMLGRVNALTPAEVYREVTEYILKSQSRTDAWWRNQLVDSGSPPTFVLKCILLERYDRHHDVKKCIKEAVLNEVRPFTTGLMAQDIRRENVMVISK